MNQHAPPVNLDAEMSVLGALLLKPDTIDDVAEILEPDMFYGLANVEIYRAILAVAESGKPVDEVITAAYLDASGKLKEIGGTERIHELAGAGLATPNAVHWAKIVRANWVKRELVSVGQEITMLGYEGQGSLTDIVAEADRKVLAISGHVNGRRDSVFSSRQLVEQFRERMAKPEDLREGITSPFPHFLRPLKGGRLYVLGGYQADGKSCLALQFLRSACEQGKRVGLASLEMGRADLTDRLVSTFGVPHHHILDGDVNAYADVVDDALGQINNWDFDVIDNESLDAGSVRRHQRKGKYDLLIFDHLHTIPIRDKRHEREELSDSVRRFRNIAREFDIPVLLLSQLSRGMKHDPYPRPTMADVRGTSAIESEAAMVLFVYRLRKDNERTTDAELLVAKNRYGAEGYLNLRFRPSFVRFEAVSSHQTGGME